MPDSTFVRAVRPVLFGAAFGDALAAPVEFMSMADILRHYPNGMPAPAGNPALVTDDTQMMLAVARAIQSGFRQPPDPELLGLALREQFIHWLHDPDNNRAPGVTCLAACRQLEQTQTWHAASQMHSKGCGANMRVMPVALVPWSAAQRAGAAQLQAALTHGHATALAASDLTAYAIRYLADGGGTGRLLAAMVDYSAKQQRVYHHAWLGPLWQRSHAAKAEDYIGEGWEQCRAALRSVEKALHAGAPADPCAATGAGWVAEEALATALFCFLENPTQPCRVIERAAMTSGDSDSIACLAGALAGAACGTQAWPVDWYTRIEYAGGLDALCRSLAQLAPAGPTT